jgi:hypothetical protein
MEKKEKEFEVVDFKPTEPPKEPASPFNKNLIIWKNPKAVRKFDKIVEGNKTYPEFVIHSVEKDKELRKQNFERMRPYIELLDLIREKNSFAKTAWMPYDVVSRGFYVEFGFSNSMTRRMLGFLAKLGAIHYRMGIGIRVNEQYLKSIKFLPSLVNVH